VTVQDILDVKGDAVFRVEESATISDAALCMHDNRIGAVLVFADDRLAGILSERDVTRKVVARGKAPDQVLVSDVMTRDVRCVRPEMTMDDCMGLMSEKIIRHLPVLEGDKVVGVISVFDVVKNIITRQREVIRELKTEVLIANDNMRAFF